MVAPAEFDSPGNNRRKFFQYYSIHSFMKHQESMQEEKGTSKFSLQEHKEEMFISGQKYFVPVREMIVVVVVVSQESYTFYTLEYIHRYYNP